MNQCADMNLPADESFLKKQLYAFLFLVKIV